MTFSAKTAPIYRQVTQAALVGLVVNVLLAIAKLVGGIVGGSFALIADAVNSLGDIVATVLVLVALRVAQAPPDDEHPYGHTRAEGIAASNVAIIIIVSALLVGWESIQRFGTREVTPPVWTIAIAAANVVIKELLYQYKIRVGRRHKSSAIIANAWDHRADALCSLAVLIGLIAVAWGGTDYLWADEVAALVVVAAIIWSGAALFLQSAHELMDVQADSDFVQEIRAAALSVTGVEDVETLWVRKSGLEFFADIHIEVPPHMTVAQGHTVGHAVKAHLLQMFPSLRGVMVHLEPAVPRTKGP